jgi:Cell division protein FtsQ/DivIB, C-terminal
MARPSAPEPLLPRLRRLLASRAGRLLLRAGAVSLVLLVVGLVVRQARAQALRIPGARLDARAVRFVSLPPGLGPDFVAALTDCRHLAFDVSVFDEGAEDAVREVVARHPMVAAVRSVRIRYPDRVDVRVDLRRPAAWLRVRGPGGRPGYLLVSQDGHLLPDAPYARLLARTRVPLPVVTGVRAAPPRYAGQSWQDPDEQVAEGLAAAAVAVRLYQDLLGRVHVQTIDVSRFPAPVERRHLGEVRLVLQDGTVVEWGRTDRARQRVASEDGYETKAWRLERLLERPDRRPGGRLEVRFPLPGEGRDAPGP